MYKTILVCSFFLSTSIFSQNKQKSTLEEAEIEKTIQMFFEGFHNQDTIKIKNTIGKELVLQTVYTTKKGTIDTRTTDTQKFLIAIASKPSDQKWEERILSYTVKADEYIANAWTPYEFYINGTFSHCGVNIFQLFNDGTSWKIIAIADTRHKQGCNNSSEK